MGRTGVANLPLHGGRAPRWLFDRMARLAPAVVEAIVVEHGSSAVLERLSDPYWFQAFGCVLGFDWHSSGVTTTVCGALKAGLTGREADTGLHVAGGKGRASRRTPAELLAVAERTGLDGEALVYNSRMSAKVDNSAVQDGYQLYHHCFFVSTAGEWAVVQQGMRDVDGSARRYHWLGRHVSDLVCEPHAAICAQTPEPRVLNLVARESAGARTATAEIARQPPDRVLAELGRAIRLDMPSGHAVHLARDVDPRFMHTILTSTYEGAPADFESLLAIRGVGPKAVRSLALLAELVHGEAASIRDPARFSFAHGGKDGHPFPVDRETYDRTTEWMRDALRQARMGRSDRVGALKRLARWSAAPTPRGRGRGAENGAESAGENLELF